MIQMLLDQVGIAVTIRWVRFDDGGWLRVEGMLNLVVDKALGFF